MNTPVPCKILAEHTIRNHRMGWVEFAGIERPVFLDLVPEARVGDYVLIHVGFALKRVTPEQAENN